jgi:hypothetical protein
MPLSALDSRHVEELLEHINVPSYVIDSSGVVRWSSRIEAVAIARGEAF